jgi:hypothetical protein
LNIGLHIGFESWPGALGDARPLRSRSASRLGTEFQGILGDADGEAVVLSALPLKTLGLHRQQLAKGTSRLAALS